MALLKMLGITISTLSIVEQHSFLLLLINLLVVVNTFTKEKYPIYMRYLCIIIKHINAENSALDMINSDCPEEILKGKLERFKCAEMFSKRIGLYHDIIADIEGIKEKYKITDVHFIEYHNRYMIDNERVVAELLNLLHKDMPDDL